MVEIIVSEIRLVLIAGAVTQDDPLAQRAYFGWKARIGTLGEPKVWGKVHELAGIEYREWTVEKRERWTLFALSEIEEVRIHLASGGGRQEAQRLFGLDPNVRQDEL